MVVKRSHKLSSAKNNCFGKGFGPQMNFKVYTSNIQRKSTLCIQSEKKKEGVSYFLGKEYDSSKGIGAEASRILETWVGIPGKTFSEAISFLIDFYDLKIKDVTDRPEDRCNLSYR